MVGPSPAPPARPLPGLEPAFPRRPGSSPGPDLPGVPDPTPQPQSRGPRPSPTPGPSAASQARAAGVGCAGASRGAPWTRAAAIAPIPSARGCPGSAGSVRLPCPPTPARLPPRCPWAPGRLLFVPKRHTGALGRRRDGRRHFDPTLRTRVSPRSAQAPRACRAEGVRGRRGGGTGRW